MLPWKKNAKEKVQEERIQEERIQEERIQKACDYGYVEIPCEPEEPKAVDLGAPTSRYEVFLAALAQKDEEWQRADAACEAIAEEEQAACAESERTDADPETAAAEKPLFDREELRRKFEEQLDSIEAEVKDIADYAPTIGVRSFGYVCDAADLRELDGSHLTLDYDAEHGVLCIAEQSLKYLIYQLFGFATKAVNLESVNLEAAPANEDLPLFSRYFAEPLAAKFTVKGTRYFTDFKALFRMNDEAGEEAVED